jgi:hypothetical protein
MVSGDSEFSAEVAVRFKTITSEPSFISTAASSHDALLVAVGSAMNLMKEQTNKTAGWWDGNDAELTQAMLLRDQCPRIYARPKTSSDLRRFTDARRRCKRPKWSAKNNWFLQIAGGCNVAMVPSGPGKSTNPIAT